MPVDVEMYWSTDHPTAEEFGRHFAVKIQFIWQHKVDIIY